MPAGWVSAAVGAAGLISGLAGSSAVSDATSSANKISQQTIDTATGYYQPYMNAGTSSLTQTSNLLGLNGQDAADTAMKTFQASPGYAYQKQQGIDAIDAGAASKGLLHSGGTIKAEQTLGDYLANSDYSNYLSRLSGLTTTGLNATTGLSNLMSGQSTSQQNTITSGASQQASIYGNTAGNLSNAVGTAYKNGLFGNTGGTSTSGSGASYNTSGYSNSDIAAINNPYNY